MGTLIKRYLPRVEIVNSALLLYSTNINKLGKLNAGA